MIVLEGRVSYFSNDPAFHLYCTGSSHRRKSAAGHIIDMIWPYHSLIPVEEVDILLVRIKAYNE